jgi:dTDP-4-amino-4,6-dideoxygalactose transaminase
MIPRKRLDIAWADILHGVLFCVWSEAPETIRKRIESEWCPGDASLACLSVRSGFDALLHALDFPPGSEMLVSAVTIPDMVRIIEARGFVPVPVDIEMRQLAVRPESLARAVTPRTRAVLVAHLFGSRMPMDLVLRIAREHGLLVIEDCAQAYSGDDFHGHPESHVRMFSFGPIKTATALGGGILSFRDPSLCTRVHRHMSRWPIQSQWRFLARIAKYCLLMLLSYRPVYTLFVLGCRALTTNHDRVISGTARGFPARGLFAEIRQRPSPALLALLDRRLRGFNPAGIADRVALAQYVGTLMPFMTRPGDRALHHTNWLFPILHETPERLMRYLWTKGFDATRGESSLCVVNPPADRPETVPAEANHAMARFLYLPVYPGVTPRDTERLADAIVDFAGHNEMAQGRVWPKALG